MAAPRVARLAAVGGIGALVLLSGYWVFAAALILPHSAVFSDFRVYYAAAWVGTHYGWGHIYDARLASLAPVPGLYPFANPPLVAWLAAPLTALPYSQGQPIWTALIALLTVGAAWSVSLGGTTRSKFVGTALVLATLPALVTIAFGQSIAICLAAIAAARVLDRKEHPVLAGVALSLAFLKPQDVVLVPLQLLVARRFRTVAALAVSGAVLLGVSVATVGPSGLAQWFAQVDAARQFPGMRQWDLETYMAPALAWAIRVSVVALAASVAHFARRTDEALAAGVIGSLLISPYGSPADFVLLVYFVAQMLVAPASMVPRSTPYMVVAGAAWLVTSTMTTTRGLVSIGEFALLVALFVAGMRRTSRSHAEAQLQPASKPSPLRSTTLIDRRS